MPADGISLPPKKGDFGTSRWGGSKVRLHQATRLGEGGIDRSCRQVSGRRETTDDSPRSGTHTGAAGSLLQAMCSVIRTRSPNGLYGISARRPALFRLDVGRPDHLASLFGLVGDKLTEVGGRAWKHCATKVAKPRLDFGIGEARVDLRIELVANASTLGVLCWKSSRENIVSTANFLGR